MILIVGASASGKTVIAKYLIDTYHFKKFVTSTTRPVRVGEKQNIDYHFLTDEEFDTKIANNDFIEHVTYNGYKYGSERKEIGTNKILIVEPKGLETYLALKDNSIISFYIECDEKIRESRMITRNDNKDDIKKRIMNDRNIFTRQLENKVNYTIDSSFTKIQEIGDQIYKLYTARVTGTN
jgi:Guanylate kinase